MAFRLTAGDWQETSMEIPSEGTLVIVRLHLPVRKGPVQPDWIELQCGKERRRSDF